MIVRSKHDLYQIIGYGFAHYLSHSGSIFQKEIELLSQLSNPNHVIISYIGNCKRGKQEFNRHDHISRFIKDEEKLFELKQLFLGIHFNGNESQDDIRYKIWSTIGHIDDIGTIVLNDLSYRVCLNLNIPMTRIYIQSKSYNGASELQDAFHKFDLCFPLKVDKNLNFPADFLSHNLVATFTGCIENQHFENFLCIYFNFIQFIKNKTMNTEVIKCDELTHIFSNISKRRRITND